ncbi:hypothetical protein D3C85_1482330 [compost metagenome]
MAEQHVIETPLRRCQHARDAHFATYGNIGQAHAAAAGIARRPGFTRTGVRRMAIGAQGLAVGKGMGQRGQQLLAVGPHQFGANSGGSDLDQNDVIQPHAIE